MLALRATKPETRAGAGPDPVRPFQPTTSRASSRPILRRAADARRPLHAPGGPAQPTPRPSARLGDSTCQPGGLGAHGDPQHRRVRQVLQRPHHRRICPRHLGRRALPGDHERWRRARAIGRGRVPRPPTIRRVGHGGHGPPYETNRADA
ncbi:MAG: hypothetical protein MZW92_64860 [Comamonadaceae bacterium]|nr:hypothetical protein [Comamonadaceae bacterium]